MSSSDTKPISVFTELASESWCARTDSRRAVQERSRTIVDLRAFSDRNESIDFRASLRPCADCPHDCPRGAPKQRLQSQRQPTRSIGEVENTEGFTRRIEVGREADFRLANRLTPQVAKAPHNDGSDPSISNCSRTPTERVRA